MIEVAFMLTVALCVGAVALGLLWALVGHAAAGAALLMLAFLTEAVFVTVPAVSVGLLIYPADAVMAVLFFAAVVRVMFRGSRLSSYHVVLLGIFCLFMLSFLRGIDANGLKPSGVEARGTFYLLTSALYFSTFDALSVTQSRIQRLWLLSCLALLALALLRWAGVEVGDTSEITAANPMRVLVASQTLFLAAGFFLSLYMNLNKVGAWWERNLLYPIAPAIVVLQHRTVWIGTIAGLIWLAWRDRRVRRHSLAIGGGILIVGGIVAALLHGDKLAEMRAMLETSASNGQTWDWRVEGWTQLMEGQQHGLLPYVIGTPLGGGFVRYFGDQAVDVSPHNGYLQIYLRTGILGLLLFVTLYVTSWRRVFDDAVASEVLPDSRFYEVVLILQMLYCITYAVGYPEGTLLGVLAAASTRLPARRRLRLDYACA